MTKQRRRTTGWALAAAGSVMSLMGASQADTALPDTDWASYNGDAYSQRYSALDQITPANAGQLKEVCRLKVAESGTFHTGIVLMDGTLFITTAHDTIAIDPTTCAQRWRHTYVPEEADVFPINRGVAYLNGKLYRGTPDGRLLALDATTGKLVWKQQIAEPKVGEFISSVPVVWAGTLITATAGGDWGIRGRVMGVDAATGRQLWNFYTIPMGKEQGADSWKDPRAAERGGGGSWTTFSVDHARGEVYVPVGNPAPDFTPIPRLGANLFTDSVVVLDVRTGQLKWWFQMAAHDSHDVDLGAPPMLYFSNKSEPMIAIGSKDGYLYGVNRDTHKEVWKSRTTTIENEGVPIPTKGVHVCPGPLGGTEWNGPAWDDKNRAIIVQSVDWCAHLFAKPTEWRPGQIYLAGSWKSDPKGSGWVLAADPDNGSVRWRYHADGPVVAAVTPTAGGVVFTGDMAGNFIVLDSSNGKELLKSPTGGGLAGGVITYRAGGQQYVAFASGNVSRLTFGETGSPTLVIYGLNGQGSQVPAAGAAPSAATVASGPPEAVRGKLLYLQNCSACHGANAEGAVGPGLVNLKGRMTFEQTVEWIKNPKPPMPKLFPSPLDEQSVLDISAYLQTL